MHFAIFSNLFASVPLNNSIKFTENKGQWESNILFKADLSIGTLFIEKNRLTYLFTDKEAVHKLQHAQPIDRIKFHSVSIELEASNKNIKIEKTDATSEYYNYFLGDDPSKWSSYVKSYKKITLKNVYKGIDLELNASNDKIKINFIVAPKSDPKQIRLKYSGFDKIFLDEENLKITTSLGELTEEKPVSFQSYPGEQVVIGTKYILNKNVVSFDLENYDSDKKLIIDPAVIFGTYVGSAADNFGFSATFDKQGNAYGAGTVYAQNFPVTTGAFDVVFKSGSSTNSEYPRDAFIAKFSPGGQQLLFATFIGGNNNEQPHSMIVNDANELVLFGTTTSTNFPTSASAFDKTYNGNGDIFIIKLSLDGSTLLASTYFGGTALDGVNGDQIYNYSSNPSPLAYNYADWYRGEILTDQLNNVYLASTTRSRQNEQFPLINANQANFGGGLQDGFLVKLNSNLSSIAYSTYIGGSGDDACYALSLDRSNNVFVTGGTNSSNLPYTSINGSYQGSADGFLVKFNSGGIMSRLSYVGTSGFDQCFFVQVDNNNDVYVTGQSTGNMGTTPGVYSNVNGKQFIRIYDNNIGIIKASTVFGAGGPAPELSPSAFLVDQCGRIYVSGWGGATNYNYNYNLGNVYNLPTTTDAFQRSTDGSDFYLFVLSPMLKTLHYATYYGGNISQEHVDGGTSHFDKNGVIYQSVCAGCGGYSDLPTSFDAYSRTNPGKRAYNTNIGGCNLGLFKMDLNPSSNEPEFKDTLITVYAGDLLAYNIIITDKDKDTIDFFANSIIFSLSNNATITDTIRQQGLTRALLKWQTNCSNANSDTLVITFDISDNACPNPHFKQGKIKIIVKSEKINPPYPECLKAINDNEVEIRWGAIPLPGDFRYHKIIKSTNGGPFTLLDTVSDPFTNNFPDKKAFNHIYQNYCYKIFTTNECGLTGDTSRSICSVFQNDTSTNPGFSEMNDTLIYLKAFDTLSLAINIRDMDGKDSMYISIHGDLIDNGKMYSNKITTIGLGVVVLKWQPGCNDVSKDTQFVYVNVRDNQCPQARSRLKKIKLLVDPPSPINPPILSCAKTINDNTLEIKWTKIDPKPYTDKFYLIRSEDGSNINVLLSSTDFNTQIFVDALAFKNKTTNYCYRIGTVDLCKYHGDSSNIVCSVRSPSDFPDAVNFYTVTVVDDKEIKLVWLKSGSNNFWRYGIEKKNERGNSEMKQITFIENIDDTTYTDIDVDVDQNSYCYKVVNYSNCGVESLVNPEMCSILLQGKSNPFVHNIDWLPFEYWAKGVSRYIIKRNEPMWYSDSSIGFTPDKFTFFVDDKLNYDNGLYQYTIVAEESLFGAGAYSQSNTIDLIQKPIVYTPNAYTDNGDGVNDEWKTLPVFVKDFNLKIFNRWGEKIWETNDQKASFNSIVKEQKIDIGVYFYIINYTGWDSSSHNLLGNITLLR